MTDNLISNLSQPGNTGNAENAGGNNMNDNNTGNNAENDKGKKLMNDNKAGNNMNEDDINDKVVDLDPVLIIVANQNWINQNTYVNYQAVVNAFATNNLHNRCRDEGSPAIFHFPNATELYTEPIGTAWILHNVAVRRSDFALDDSFFVFQP
ncbi:hypothetical protein RhiirA4_473421 [Rhizophagus irregularis]|uniref:Uncharacterized protein n=1 Tax=Rhizophagus irregularis TaxID=588596 RepID=A0A2I1H6P3_9GLOM|nr:hypothetical protein RhiirA4_473421 [Rhizophagus irregularis]